MKPVLLAFCDFWYELVTCLIRPIDRLFGWSILSGFEPLGRYLILPVYQFLFFILGGKIALSFLSYFGHDLEQA